MDYIYLNIAECLIKITFGEMERTRDRRNFIRDMQLSYKPFIIKSLKKRPDYTIDVIWNTQLEEILREDGKHYVKFCEHTRNNRVVTYYQSSFSDINIILRDILYAHVTHTNGFIVHASGVFVASKRYVALFVGAAGAGKSTATKLLNTGYRIVTDDMAIIKKEQDAYVVYQTPFFEKNWKIIKQTKPMKLGEVFFIRKTKKARRIELTDAQEIFQEMLPEVFHDSKQLPKTISILREFICQNSFTLLCYPKDRKILRQLVEKSK